MGTRKGMDFLEGQNGRTVKTTLKNLVLEKTRVSFLYIPGIFLFVIILV